MSWFRGSSDKMSGSSPSPPATVSHVNELADCNERLSTYTEHVRKLEWEKDQLSRTLEEREATSVRQAERMKEIYEAELAAMRSLMDKLASSNATLQASISKLQKDLEYLKVVEKELEAETIQRVNCDNKIKTLEEQIAFNTQLHEEVAYIACTVRY